MALKKTIQLPDGSTAEYIRISKLESNKLNVKISIDIYKSKADRDAGRSPSIKNYKQKNLIAFHDKGLFSFVASDYDSNWYDEAYDFLRNLPDFSGAEDI